MIRYLSYLLYNVWFFFAFLRALSDATTHNSRPGCPAPVNATRSSNREPHLFHVSTEREQAIKRDVYSMLCVLAFEEMKKIQHISRASAHACN